MARRGRRRAAVADLAGLPPRRSRRHHGRDDGRTRGRVGGPRVVAVLQPGALGRARGRHRADGRRGRRDKARRSPVHCGRGDGDDAAYLRRPGPEPRARHRGAGLPSPVQRTSSRVAGRRHRARVRSVHAPSDRRHHRRRRFRFPLAVDADSRATSPRPSPSRH